MMSRETIRVWCRHQRQQITCQNQWISPSLMLLKARERKIPPFYSKNVTFYLDWQPIIFTFILTKIEKWSAKILHFVTTLRQTLIDLNGDALDWTIVTILRSSQNPSATITSDFLSASELIVWDEAFRAWLPSSLLNNTVHWINWPKSIKKPMHFSTFLRGFCEISNKKIHLGQLTSVPGHF